MEAEISLQHMITQFHVGIDYIRRLLQARIVLNNSNNIFKYFNHAKEDLIEYLGLVGSNGSDENIEKVCEVFREFDQIQESAQHNQQMDGLYERIIKLEKKFPFTRDDYFLADYY